MMQFDQRKQSVGRDQYNAEHITIHQVLSETQVLSDEVKVPVWNIPFPRNAVFTGREQLLAQLAATLHAGQPTALSQPQAISGLGGIGKTQIAIEYAYQHRQDYQAVLWTRADTRETLIAGYVEIARVLNLPQKDEQDQGVVVHAVLQWLKTQTAWLLVLDNADDLRMAREFLPLSPAGHILLTTRVQAMGRLARRIEVEIMEPDLGAHFLLRRAGVIAQDAPPQAASFTDAIIARGIAEELGGLPLALDQAGAYIEETGCGLSDYQRLFQHRRLDLLAERGGLVDDHPLPVATTWSLSFVQVEQKNPAAADLLRLCAFLAPEAIPEAIITKGASDLGPYLATIGTDVYLLNQSIEVLRAYSLVRREVRGEAGNLLSVHRLVQVVLQDAMDEQSKKEWAERAVRAINAAFPDVEYQNWSQCDQLLSHAKLSADLIKEYDMAFSEAARLLKRAGLYLQERARYQEAEPLYERALAIREQQLGADHPDAADSLNNLATLYYSQGKYAKAEPLLIRALAIREQQLGADHSDTANSLNNLAALYYSQGKYAKAEPLYERALAIREQRLGADHSDTANSLNSLAAFHYSQGKYAKAEPLYQRALAIQEQRLGAEHPDTAISLNNLAALYYSQGKYVEAEPLYQRALAIREQQLGAEHPDTANSLNNLAELYRSQGKYVEAEPLYERALAIREQQLGAEHSDTAISLNNLAALYYSQGKYVEAEPLYQRALAIREQQLGAEHPDTARSLNNLAELYRSQGKYAEAKPLYVRALTIREQALGSEHLDTALSLLWLAILSQQQQHAEEAKGYYQRALWIYERTLGAEHPTTQHVRQGYTTLLGVMKQDEETT